MNGWASDDENVAGVQGVNRGWLMALGLLMLVLGVIGLTMTYTLTGIVIFWFGILAIIAGLGQLLDAWHHKKWRGVIWHVIVGAVYILLGILLIAIPITAAFWLTLAVAISLLVTGLMRILLVFHLRGHPGLQLLVLVAALVSIGLAFFIYQTLSLPDAASVATPADQVAWARSWGWVIGLFVAIELITEGITLIAIAVTGKSLPTRSQG